jgi:hypothetical protein
MKPDNFESVVDRLLTYLCCSEEGGLDGYALDAEPFKDVCAKQIRFMRVPLTYFNGADPFPSFDEFKGRAKSYERLFIHPDDIKPSDIRLEDWDSTILRMATEAEKPKHEDHMDAIFVIRPGIYHLTRIRRVPLKEVRGFFKLQTGIVVEVSDADIYRDGTFSTARLYCELRGGKWWAVGQPMELEPRIVNEVLAVNIEWSRSVAFTSFYDWRVELSARKDLPSISFVTDPVGTKEIFRLRDIPPGKSRREALRHWVSGHWRKKNDEPFDLTHVLPYLRGAQEFSWNGLFCKIVPSKHDLKKATEYQLLSSKTKAVRI